MILVPEKFLRKTGNVVSYMVRHLFVVFLFATSYYVVSHYIDDNPDGDPLSPLDCFYYSLATQTTVGYGDISAKTPAMKVATIMQLMTIYGVFVVELF
jgi:voltage-gated potassium channel